MGFVAGENEIVKRLQEVTSVRRQKEQVDKVFLGLKYGIEVLVEAKVVNKEGGHNARLPLPPNLAKFIQNLTPKIAINETSVRKTIEILGKSIASKLKQVMRGMAH